MTPTKTHTPAKTKHEFHFSRDELIPILKDQVLKSGQLLPSGDYSLHGLNPLFIGMTADLVLEVETSP